MFKYWVGKKAYLDFSVTCQGKNLKELFGKPSIYIVDTGGAVAGSAGLEDCLCAHFGPIQTSLVVNFYAVCC